MKQERQGTLWGSVAVFALVLGVLMYGILVLKLSAHLPLVAAIAIVTLYGRFCLGISLKELENAWRKMPRVRPSWCCCPLVF